VSLSEDEHKELERLRKQYKKRMARDEAKDKWAWALSKGFGVAIVSSAFIQRFRPDTVFWRIFHVFGVLICFAVGILSSYYGPFKEKKEVIPVE